MPTPDLSMDFERRFGGIARLHGADGAGRIWDAHVAVVGLGGVGSWAAECLARSGVRALTLIDLDQVAESNINRQVLALDSTLGMAKVLAMQQRIQQINPLCDVTVVEDFVTPDNCDSLLPSGLSAVLDACDQMSAKAALALWARAANVPFVTAGAAGGKRLAHQVEMADLADVTHDPLLANLRYRLRKQHGLTARGAMGVHCVFSREPVTQAADACASDGSLNCAGYGSFAPVTATFGHCAAGWILNRLATRTAKTRL